MKESICSPTRGTASLVIGINSETIFIKTVSESITVTPEINEYYINEVFDEHLGYPHLFSLIQKCFGFEE